MPKFIKDHPYPVGTGQSFESILVIIFKEVKRGESLVYVETPVISRDNKVRQMRLTR